MVVEKLNAQVAMATTRVAEVFQSLNISGQVNATVDRAYGALRQATNVYTDAVRIQGQVGCRTYVGNTGTTCGNARLRNTYAYYNNAYHTEILL